MICRITAAKSQLDTFKKYNTNYIFSNLVWQINLPAILDSNCRCIPCRLAAVKSQLDVNEYKIQKKGRRLTDSFETNSFPPPGFLGSNFYC